MAESTSIIQKITKQLTEEIDVANIYYSIILSINNIHITKRKLQLISFIACKGLSSVTNRQEFCYKYNSSQATVNNMVGELIEQKLLIKENGRIKVTPSISLDFKKDIILDIKLSNAHG